LPVFPFSAFAFVGYDTDSYVAMQLEHLDMFIFFHYKRNE
jgi:hypothetical protein